ncbi:MAG: formate dehydrogenase subunit delta [Methylothermaceae bacterium]|nr:formate dehydrogenase subunit delta [Methylothermaceae bacterium]
MNVEQLVKMANDIAAFFSAEPDHQTAVDGVYNHIKRFWDPRMRQQITAHLQSDGSGLCDLATEALQRLETEQKQQKAS